MFPRDASQDRDVKPLLEAAGIEPAQDSPGLCVACPAEAVYVFPLDSGRIGRLCESCFQRYKRHAVYFLRAGDLVKIGFSTDVRSRVQTLKTASPIPLELWRVVPASRALEAELHERFAADRSHGEWFHISDAIREYVEAA